MESPPDPVHTEHLLCSWGPLEDGAPELSPRLCPQQARNTCLWEMGKTETLSCPGAQVKGGLSLAETGDRRRQRWLLGCIWGSPSWSHPLGSRRKTGSNSPDHEKPCQPHPDSHPEVWPYLPREGALHAPRSLLGQASHVWVGAQGSEAKAESRRMEKD